MEPPSRVQITVVSGPPSAKRSLLAPVAVLLVIVVALVAAVVTPGQRARQTPRLATVAQLDVTGGSDALRGPAFDPIAAAYRYPYRCLRFTMATADPSYARADLDRASSCARRAAWSATVLHRVAGAWKPVLVLGSEACPVHSIPRAVQTQLGVCPRRRGLKG